MDFITWYLYSVTISNEITFISTLSNIFYKTKVETNEIALGEKGKRTRYQTADEKSTMAEISTQLSKVRIGQGNMLSNSVWKIKFAEISTELSKMGNR